MSTNLLKLFNAATATTADIPAITHALRQFMALCAYAYPQRDGFSVVDDASQIGLRASKANSFGNTRTLRILIDDGRAIATPVLNATIPGQKALEERLPPVLLAGYDHPSDAAGAILRQVISYDLFAPEAQHRVLPQYLAAAIAGGKGNLYIRNTQPLAPIQSTVTDPLAEDDGEAQLPATTPIQSIPTMKIEALSNLLNAVQSTTNRVSAARSLVADFFTASLKRDATQGQWQIKQTAGTTIMQATSNGITQFFNIDWQDKEGRARISHHAFPIMYGLQYDYLPPLLLAGYGSDLSAAAGILRMLREAKLYRPALKAHVFPEYTSRILAAGPATFTPVRKPLWS